jgi:hypothetical protein
MCVCCGDPAAQTVSAMQDTLILGVAPTFTLLNAWGSLVFSAHQFDNLDTSIVEIFLLNNTPAITFV